MANSVPNSDFRREKAKSFFDQGDVYLRKDASIELRSQLVRSLLGDVRGCRVLDVGCGDGRVSLQLLPDAAHVTLLDISEQMLARAERRIPDGMRDRVTLVQGIAQGFRASAPFDIVLCIGVFAHVSDPPALWATLSELVAKGGRCVVQISDYDAPMGKLLTGMSELRRRISDSRGYALNPTRSSEFLRMASASQFELAGEERHWRFPPGVGLLPNDWMRRVLHWTQANPRLHRLASERVMLFVRR